MNGLWIDTKNDNSFNNSTIIRIKFKNVDLILFLYKESYTNIKTLNFRKFTEEDYKIIGESFSKSAKEHNLIVHTCFEVET